MSDRAILHSDANCFYASVEMALNPELRGKAIAVCGSIEDRHGIVLARAKRQSERVSRPEWLRGRLVSFAPSLS